MIRADPSHLWKSVVDPVVDPAVWFLLHL